MRDLLDLADKFLVYSLIHVFEERVSLDILWTCYHFAVERCYAGLTIECSDYVAGYPLDCLNLPAFLQVSGDVIRHFISRNDLMIDEGTLFTRCLTWSEAECERQGLDVTPVNQRQVMASFLELIRFPVMSVAEFLTGPATSGVLTLEETTLVSRYLVLDEEVPSMKFCRDMRIFSSHISRAEEQRRCPNKVLCSKKLCTFVRVGSAGSMMPVLLQDLKSTTTDIHVYRCRKCCVHVCAVCARDCHAEHDVRYERLMSAVCCCPLGSCSFVPQSCLILREAPLPV